jgi:hypothetical protein
MPLVLLPKKGRFGLVDYEKIFCPDREGRRHLRPPTCEPQDRLPGRGSTRPPCRACPPAHRIRRANWIFRQDPDHARPNAWQASTELEHGCRRGDGLGRGIERLDGSRLGRTGHAGEVAKDPTGRLEGQAHRSADVCDPDATRRPPLPLDIASSDTPALADALLGPVIAQPLAWTPQLTADRQQTRSYRQPSRSAASAAVRTRDSPKSTSLLLRGGRRGGRRREESWQRGRADDPVRGKALVPRYADGPLVRRQSDRAR